MIRAVLFDAFETTIRKPVYHNVWKTIRELSTSPVYPDPLTEHMDLRTYADILSVPYQQEWDAMLQEETDAIMIYEGVIPLLDELRLAGIPVVIASNLASPYGPPVMSELGDLVSHYHLSYEQGKKKPDPSFLRDACGEVFVNPQKCLFVGNSRRDDLAAGDASNIRTLLISENPSIKEEVARDEAYAIIRDWMKR